MSTPAPPRAKVERVQDSYIGKELKGRPWIAHVRAVDLDQDGLIYILACESKEDKVLWLRQLDTGDFQETTIGSDMQGPVHVESYDLDGDGDLDLVVGQFGYDQGEIRWMRNVGHWKFESEILARISGTIHVTIDDYTGDGTPDIAALASQ